jgi:hypothetical protein
MTPRPHARTRRAAAILLLASVGLMSLAGCDPRTLIYFLQPFEPSVPPPDGSPSLKGKRVVVIASTSSSSQGQFPSLERDLVREFTQQLRNKVKRIDVVNPDKVWEWVENHPNWTDPAEVAEKHEADMAIYLEVEEFQVQKPGDLNVFEGTSKVHIKVIERAHPKNSRGRSLTDQPKEARTIYDQYVDSQFPRRGPIDAASGVSRDVFKNKFLQIVAVECSWQFVEHAPEDAIQDTKFDNR